MCADIKELVYVNAMSAWFLLDTHDMVRMEEDLIMRTRKKEYHANRKHHTDTSNPLGTTFFQDTFVVQIVYNGRSPNLNKTKE